ncbi:MAG: DUF2953 domain-containing protein [Fidelibacterota bacterium]
METAALFLLGLFSLVAILVAIPWYVNWTFRLFVEGGAPAWVTSVNLGFKNRGIGISVREGSRRLTVGSVEHPRWEKKIGTWKRLRGRRRRGRKRFPILRLAAIRPALKGRIASFLRSVRWVSFRINGEIGLDDPGSTGRLFGVLWAVAGMIPDGYRQVNVTPNFTERRVDVSLRSTFRMRPAVLVWTVGPLWWEARRHSTEDKS